MTDRTRLDPDFPDGAKELRRIRFKKNNGIVLNQVNRLRNEQVSLADVRDLVTQILIRNLMSEQQLIDSLNYLWMKGFIVIRRIRDGAEVDFSKVDDLNILEAKVTDKGVDFLNGDIECAGITL